MNKLILESLKLKNFKGVPSFIMESGSNDLAIQGDNATGKTTLYDAFNWLLFGKDSMGKADFQIKPTDSEGKQISQVDVEVEGSFIYNDLPLILKKRYYENWTKKRGGSNKSFTGHKTDYFINEVPVKKKDYESKISEIINDKIFKLLTDPREFNHIHWQDRRNVLIELCGGINDADIVQKIYPSVNDNDKFSYLARIIDNSNMDDQQKIIASKKRDLNKEIEKIPVRIDEVNESIKELPAVDSMGKVSLISDIKRVESDLRQLDSDEALSSLKVKLNQVESSIISRKNEHNKKEHSALKLKTDPIDKSIASLKKEKRPWSKELETLEITISTIQNRLKIQVGAADNLRNDWHRESKLEPSVDSVCPCCQQSLPEDQIDNAVEKFNTAKAEKLKSIQTEGVTLKDGIEEKQKDIEAKEIRVKELREKVRDRNIAIDEKEKELSKISQTEYVQCGVSDLEKEKADIHAEIVIVKNDEDKAHRKAELKDNIQVLKESLKEIETLEAQHKAVEASKERIEELKEDEQRLAAAYEKLEGEQFLIDNFISKRSEIVEGKVNGMFDLAKFKLFNVQINGGIDPCCETIHNGVPYSKGLNNAACINVGLDIIKTLSNHYGFMAPIFIDNAESVNQLIEMDAQVVSLHVSKDKELTIK